MRISLPHRVAVAYNSSYNTCFSTWDMAFHWNIHQPDTFLEDDSFASPWYYRLSTVTANQPDTTNLLSLGLTTFILTTRLQVAPQNHIAPTPAATAATAGGTPPAPGGAGTGSGGTSCPTALSLADNSGVIRLCWYLKWSRSISGGSPAIVGGSRTGSTGGIGTCVMGYARSEISCG